MNNVKIEIKFNEKSKIGTLKIFFDNKLRFELKINHFEQVFSRNEDAIFDSNGNIEKFPSDQLTVLQQFHNIGNICYFPGEDT